MNKDDLTREQAEQIEKFLSQPFISLVASLTTSAMSTLGMIPNPMTGKVDKDLPQAEMTIELLAILKEKTTGNLTVEEQQFLEGHLAELRMQYVKAMKGNIIIP